MLRRTRWLALLNDYGRDTLLAATHQASLTDSLLLLDWPLIAEELQLSYRCNFLEVRGEPFPVIKPVITPQAGSRLATCCAVTVRKDDADPRIRWIPFIVDTGAPRAVYLSCATWELFGIHAQPRPAGSNCPVFNQMVSIGKWTGSAWLSEEHGESPARLHHVAQPTVNPIPGGHVNVIGVELLGARDVSDAFTGILRRALEKEPPTLMTWVQQYNHAGSQPLGEPFTVWPSRSSIDALKNAITAAISPKYPGVFAPDMRIHAPCSSEAAKAHLALSESDATMPYHFVLPKSHSEK